MFHAYTRPLALAAACHSQQQQRAPCSASLLLHSITLIARTHSRSTRLVETSKESGLIVSPSFSVIAPAVFCGFLDDGCDSRPPHCCSLDSAAGGLHTFAPARRCVVTSCSFLPVSSPTPLCVHRRMLRCYPPITTHTCPSCHPCTPLRRLHALTRRSNQLASMLCRQCLLVSVQSFSGPGLESIVTALTLHTHHTHHAHHRSHAANMMTCSIPPSRHACCHVCIFVMPCSFSMIPLLIGSAWPLPQLSLFPCVSAHHLHTPLTHEHDFVPPATFSCSVAISQPFSLLLSPPSSMLLHAHIGMSSSDAADLSH